MIDTLVEKKLYPHAEFVKGKWCDEINVRDFIQRNYTPYDGDASFLEGPTKATEKLWSESLAIISSHAQLSGSFIRMVTGCWLRFI